MAYRLSGRRVEEQMTHLRVELARAQADAEASFEQCKALSALLPQRQPEIAPPSSIDVVSGLAASDPILEITRLREALVRAKDDVRRLHYEERRLRAIRVVRTVSRERAAVVAVAGVLALLVAVVLIFWGLVFLIGDVVGSAAQPR
jgi:hypothetical protein